MSWHFAQNVLISFFVCLFEAEKSQATFSYTLKSICFPALFLRGHMYDHKHRHYFHLNGGTSVEVSEKVNVLEG